MRNKFPNLGRTKEILYRGCIIHLYEDNMVGCVLGNLSIYGPDHRELFHATLAKDVAWEERTEQNARDTVDRLLDNK